MWGRPSRGPADAVRLLVGTTRTLWYVGPDALLPNALVHSPLSFVVHGVLVEADSLVSV